MVHVRAMRPEDTVASAAIHIEGQPDAFLSSFGERFVATLFAYIVSSPHGFGFVAVEDGEVIGFAVATTCTRRLFRDVLTRGFVPLAWAALSHALRRPSVLPKLFETVRYPERVRGAAEAEAEGISRGVRSDWRGKGVGSLLWVAQVSEARRRGSTHILTTVDRVHVVINAWHRARGHELLSTFTMYERPTDVYRIPLNPEIQAARQDPSKAQAVQGMHDLMVGGDSAG